MSTDLLHRLCSVPTAPFAEHRVLRFVRDWAKTSGLRVSVDTAGNLLVERPGRSRKPRLVLVAHADHPGFTAGEMADRRTLAAKFHGYVLPSFFVGSRVRFFATDGEIVGTVQAVEAGDGRPSNAIIRVNTAVPPGTPGMWDAGGPRVRGHKFHCRVCDDLAGLAAGLQALADSRAPAAVLVTRAEEEGFIGAIAACRSGKLLRPTDRVVSIETSAEQPYAKQGDGVVVRVGDRTSVFHSAFTRLCVTQAEALAKDNPAFKFQRALMPGGTCEATVFDAFGYVAAAVCVPLGNYHNMNAASGKIAAEYIDLRDWRSLTALLTALCDKHGDFDGGHEELKTRLLARYDGSAALL